MGLHFTACAPKKYQPDAALIAQCQAIAAETGATLTLRRTPPRPPKVPMSSTPMCGSPWASPLSLGRGASTTWPPIQINQELMNIAGPKAVFMHCLPAYHDHKTAVGKEMGERFGRDAWR